MKWIGQHIVNLIARFRGDVYLENLANEGSDPDRFLTMNRSTGKVSYRSGLEVLSDIGAGSGDITSVKFTTDDDNTATDSSGDAEFTIAGGTGITTSVSGTTITIGDTAAKKDKSNIDSLTGVTATHLGTFTGSTITDNSSIKTALQELETRSEVSASVSGEGRVELATTGEADTGTDTARAVTPAGLKSHVDSRYSYAYMTWSASAVSSVDGSDPEWVFPASAKGVYEEDWNKDENITATSTGATTYTVTRHSAVNGFVVPHTGVCVGFHAHGRNDDSDASFKTGLFHLEGSTTSATNNGGVDYGNTGATNEATLRWIATADEAEASGGADGSGGHNFKGPCKLVSNTTAIDVTPGDVLLPAIMGPDASDEIFITMTIILKIPITT